MSEQDSIRVRLSKFSAILLDRKVATTKTIVGCSLADIQELEVDVGQSLPFVYREFLFMMGREAGKFFVGTDFFYPRILGLTSAAHELILCEKSSLKLPNDAIVFAMHQGYQFHFMTADAGIDPPVYHYMENSGQFVPITDRFSSFLLNVACDEW